MWFCVILWIVYMDYCVIKKYGNRLKWWAKILFNAVMATSSYLTSKEKLRPTEDRKASKKFINKTFLLYTEGWTIYSQYKTPTHSNAFFPLHMYSVPVWQPWDWSFLLIHQVCSVWVNSLLLVFLRYPANVLQLWPGRTTSEGGRRVQSP